MIRKKIHQILLLINDSTAFIRQQSEFETSLKKNLLFANFKNSKIFHESSYYIFKEYQHQIQEHS
ncbi:MAG: hypothetical protein BGO40_03820 [Chryseobacterium sp. 39-10]|nr:MAG: hypothetical protein BGO40_03820 [Chryseobacterium sp. 39-10]